MRSRSKAADRPDLGDYLARFHDRANAIRQVFGRMPLPLKQDAERREFVFSTLTQFGDGPPADGEERSSFVTATGPARFSRFEVKRELGRGSFGVVYLAYDPRLRREVALKVPRRNACNRLRLS